MIRREEEEFAAFCLSEGDIAVPVEICLPQNSSLAEITVYPAFVSVVEEWERTFGIDLFSEAAKAYLLAALDAPMRQYGFTPSPDIHRCIRELEMTDAEALNPGVILPDTMLLCEENPFPALFNATTHKLDTDDAPLAYHAADGQLVAYAACNDSIEGDGGIEIHVECAPGYRGRGYATSCAARLTSELLARGEAVLYRVWTENRASLRIAEKVGFTPTGTRQSYVYYHQNKN